MKRIQRCKVIVSADAGKHKIDDPLKKRPKKNDTIELVIDMTSDPDLIKQIETITGHSQLESAGKGTLSGMFPTSKYYGVYISSGSDTYIVSIYSTMEFGRCYGGTAHNQEELLALIRDIKRQDKDGSIDNHFIWFSD